MGPRSLWCSSFSSTSSSADRVLWSFTDKSKENREEYRRRVLGVGGGQHRWVPWGKNQGSLCPAEWNGGAEV